MAIETPDNLIVAHMLAHFVQICWYIGVAMGTVLTFFFVRLGSKIGRSEWEKKWEEHKEEHGKLDKTLKEIIEKMESKFEELRKDLKELNDNSIRQESTTHSLIDRISKLGLDRDVIMNEIRSYFEFKEKL
jgi:hypothetical protein